MSVLKKLFRWRLLPARFCERVPYEYEVRRSDFLGLFSYLEGLHPAYTDYLKSRGVAYRLKKRMASNGRLDPYIAFWSKEDYDIFLDTIKPQVVYVTNRDKEQFEDALRELGIAYLRSSTPYDHRFTIISTCRMIELMLRFEFERQSRYLTCLVSMPPQANSKSSVTISG